MKLDENHLGPEPNCSRSPAYDNASDSNNPWAGSNKLDLTLKHRLICGCTKVKLMNDAGHHCCTAGCRQFRVSPSERVSEASQKSRGFPQLYPPPHLTETR